MSKRWLFVAAMVVVLTFQPLVADSPDVQVVATTVTDAQITFHVENASTTARPVRVQVSVLITDGSTRLLTTGTVNVPGAGTSTVSVSSAEPIVGIIDEPDPVPQ